MTKIYNDFFLYKKIKKIYFFYIKKTTFQNYTNGKERHSEESWFLKIPNLVEVQRRSYFNFVEYGVKNELQRHQVLFQYLHLELIFYPQRLLLRELA